MEASQAGGLGYWRERSNSGVNRIFDAWPYVGLIAMTLTEAVLGIFLTACAAVAGSREYRRRLRRLRSSSSRLEP